MDWLRGLSVLFMIECHSLIFLDPKYAYSHLLMTLNGINGMVSVAFLFTSGFAGGLVGARAAKDSAARKRRAKRTFWRLLQVLVMSLYFHSASAPIYTHPATLLQVDILFCIAIGVMAVWLIVTLCSGHNAVAIFVLVTTATLILIFTPPAVRYRGGTIVTELLNSSTGSMFPIFPWLIYPLLGAAMGVIAATPNTGRRRLIFAIIALLLVTWTINQPFLDAIFWSHFPNDDGLFWVRNGLERIWILCVVLLALFTIDYAALALASVSWSRLFVPLERTVDFFSRHALFGYFAHLSLLYGFLTFQFTNQWHHRSTWTQYTWRMLIVIAGTAVVCMVIHRVKRLLDSLVRNVPASRKLPDTPLAPVQES